MKRMLTFDDVWLQPFFNNVDSRTEPNLGTLLSKDCFIETPLVASCMESVIGDELADLLIERGSAPIFHRFTTKKIIREWIQKYTYKAFISWGVNDIDNLLALIKESGSRPRGVCLDVAHGHSVKMERAIKTLKDANSALEIIAGAVCTKIAVHDLAGWGADAVRVGIGPGSACTTRSVTGFGTPQFSSIQECATVGKRLKVPIIADGGIRDSGDIVKALAAGAQTVMIGKLFAATTESAAQKRAGRVVRSIGRTDQEMLALYRGQASEVFQRQGLVPEGKEGWIPVTGSAKDLMDQLEAGIKSGLTYGGARSIQELQEHATFVEVTSSFQAEAGTRL